MSRIGKQPIQLPQNVTAAITESKVNVSGPLGSLTVPVPAEVSVREEGGKLVVALAEQTRRSPALWGLTRALLANAVRGESEGFLERLIVEGIGYRAAVEDDALVLALGFSHPVRFSAPAGIHFSVEKNTISVSGYDRQLVGNTAAAIRALRKPEPYKGKGIRRENEIVRRKAGKKAAVAK